jgi:hypothetical protein
MKKIPLIIKPNWPDFKGLKAFSTTRQGGISEGPYASLNLGTHVNDNPLHVQSNREDIAKTLDFPSSPCWLEQVHGTRVIDDNFSPNDNKADAMISKTKGKVLVVMTADCLPVLLYAPKTEEIAVIHAGWRSLAGGIVEKTRRQFQSEAASIYAWLGPCIGPNHFEVGPEVLEAFKQIDVDAEKAFIATDNKWLANLQLLARHQLLKQGISNIYADNSCTFQSSERFFSYRRDKTTGRMASFIWLCGPKK